LITYAAEPKRQVCKYYWQQLTDIVRLITSAQQLGPSEYYEFGVFDDAAYPAQKRADCVGWRASGKIDRQLNHANWRAVANDKLLNYVLLPHFGLPIPKTIACYSPQGRRVGNERQLHTRQEIEAFPRQEARFPVFIKPIHGSYGSGTYLLQGRDAASGELLGAGNKPVPMSELLDACLFGKFNGMLFQECLQPHPEMRALSGNTTSCVRLIIATTAQGPKVYVTFWKIARSHNITDNFCMGATVPGPIRTIVGVGALALLVNLLMASPPIVKSMLSFRPLCTLGMWSFSIYICQQPFYLYGRRGDLPIWLAFALAILAGLVSFHLIEKPIRNYLNRVWATHPHEQLTLNRAANET